MAYDKVLTVAGNELFNEDAEKVAEFNKDRIEYDSSKIGGSSSANDVSFDNSLTELVADNVQNAIEELADESHNIIDSLTANDTRVYMDYHEGKYGINTDEERGADTFIPFSSAAESELIFVDMPRGLSLTIPTTKKVKCFAGMVQGQANTFITNVIDGVGSDTQMTGYVNNQKYSDYDITITDSEIKFNFAWSSSYDYKVALMVIY